MRLPLLVLAASLLVVACSPEAKVTPAPVPPTAAPAASAALPDGSPIGGVLPPAILDATTMTATVPVGRPARWAHDDIPTPTPCDVASVRPPRRSRTRRFRQMAGPAQAPADWHYEKDDSPEEGYPVESSRYEPARECLPVIAAAVPSRHRRLDGYRSPCETGVQAA